MSRTAPPASQVAAHSQDAPWLLTGGVGPWMPFQMLAMGWFTIGAGLLPIPGRLRGRSEVVVLAPYGFLAAFDYGTVMNLAGRPHPRARAPQGAAAGHATGGVRDAGHVRRTPCVRRRAPTVTEVVKRPT